MGKRATSDVEVSEFEPERLFTLHGLSGPVRFTVRHRLSENGDGTKLDVEAEADPGGIGRLLRPVIPICPNTVRIGRTVDCSGTTSSPTTITNRMFRPGNDIHANAYAAKDAMVSGMMVEGIVMNRLFTNEFPRFAWLKMCV